MNRPQDFSNATQMNALKRQHNKCASCGSIILALGNSGRAGHKFGEGAQAHHVKPVKFGGKDDLANCVVICQSCHYSVHEGGNYRFGTVGGKPSDFAFYNGKVTR